MKDFLSILFCCRSFLCAWDGAKRRGGSWCDYCGRSSGLRGSSPQRKETRHVTIHNDQQTRLRGTPLPVLIMHMLQWANTLPHYEGIRHGRREPCRLLEDSDSEWEGDKDLASISETEDEGQHWRERRSLTYFSVVCNHLRHLLHVLLDLL